MKQMRGLFLFLFSFVLNAEGFVKGTLVKTPLGYSEIQDLQVGDKVVSCDFLSHCVERSVQKIHRLVSKKQVYLSLDQETIICDENQTFYVPQINKWLKASDLKAGMPLMDLGYASLPIHYQEAVGERVEVYTITVEQDRNFHVTKQDILAHNFAFLVTIPLGVELGALVGPVLGSLAISAIATLTAHVAGPQVEQMVNQVIHHQVSYARPENKRNAREKATRIEAESIAKREGYDYKIPPNRAPFDSHREPVYMNKNRKEALTYDRDGHSGGTFKRFKEVAKDDWRRVETLDKDMQHIGK